MVGEHVAEYGVGPRKRLVYLTPADLERARGWEQQGFTEALRTPDSTLIFVTPEQAKEIIADQIACMGCLSACRFSNWSQNEAEHTTGKKADPRSFCIQKTLQSIAHERRAGRGGTQPDVQRPQRLPVRVGPVLLERFHSDGEGTGRPDPDRRLSRSSF